MREIKFRAWDKIEEVMYTDAINNCKDSFDMVLKHPQIYEVMEYTGLKDKDGVNIYEGDIVEADNCNPKYEQIEFIEGGFCLTNPLIKGYPMDISSFYPSIGCMLTVVGNIYENPELLDA